MSEITITILSAKTGHSEVIPALSLTSTVAEVVGLAQALLSETANTTQLLLNGKPLNPPSMTLQQAGVTSGDMLVLQKPRTTMPSTVAQPPASATTTTTTTTASGGGGGGGGLLDFSNLLAAAGSNPPTTTPPNTSTTATPTVVYYPSMSLDEAMAHNPHPSSIVKLLQDQEHLWKELRYHNPKLAAALQSAPNLTAAADIWRQNAVQGSIQAALQHSNQFHARQKMQQRLAQNPNDTEAMAYFEQQTNQSLIDTQYRQMMQEYPESLSKVLMLYIPAKINGHSLQAFCDSGAQMTIMSKKMAQQCNLLGMVDTRFAGVATGVGTGKILGRIHLVQLELHDAGDNKTYYFPCTVTVMDDPPAASSSSSGTTKNDAAKEMPFLLGLDMMKRHLCQLDLQAGVLRFTAVGMQVPFLHEKDLDTEQGGTKGFDAVKANAELDQQQRDDNGNEDDKKKKQSGS